MERKGLRSKAFQKRKNTDDGNKRSRRFPVRLFFLASGLAMSVSGLIIQIRYHAGHAPDTSAVLCLDRAAWKSFHIWASAGFLPVAAYHVRAHRKWYRRAFERKASPRSRPTVILTFLTVLTAASGLVPLMIFLFDGDFFLRSAIVEIHDKTAIVFLIVVVFHIRRRFKPVARRAKSRNGFSGKSSWQGTVLEK